jgi:type II secretory pathway component PulF
MRYRIAAIWCFVLVGLMFGLPALIWATFLPSLKHALQEDLYAIPSYERMLLEIAVFCGNWKWFLALPLSSLGLLFTIKELKGTRVDV